MPNDPNPVAIRANASASSDIVFARRPGLVLRTLLAILWTWAWLVGAVDLGSWRESLAARPSGPALLMILIGLAGFVHESLVFFRSTPREVRIDAACLRLRSSKDRELAIALDEIREVRTTSKLTLVLACGEVYEFGWRKAVRTAVLSGLEASLHLQPVPGDTSGSLLRPLLYPGEPIELPVSIAPADRTCPRCQLRYPSDHWFVVDGPTREVICRPCVEGLDLERAETAASAGRSPRREASGLDRPEA